jgi:hypothetical protein
VTRALVSLLLPGVWLCFCSTIRKSTRLHLCARAYMREDMRVLNACVGTTTRTRSCTARARRPRPPRPVRPPAPAPRAALAHVARLSPRPVRPHVLLTRRRCADALRQAADRVRAGGGDDAQRRREPRGAGAGRGAALAHAAGARAGGGGRGYGGGERRRTVALRAGTQAGADARAQDIEFILEPRKTVLDNRCGVLYAVAARGSLSAQTRGPAARTCAGQGCVPGGHTPCRLLTLSQLRR